ncbi:MAG: hypothetical protein PHI73_01740 [Patescibacteria group bacterium]|nr:hypothetical protein [Patescibacteria group bacterium]
MDSFGQKYGIKEDDKVKDYHRSRRMFCIYQGKLYIADQNLSYSHATWFEKEGWTANERDGLMDKITRGIIDDQGDIYFYAGFDFRVNDEIESIFFAHLKELVEKLKLDARARIFGGTIKSEPGKKWPPAKEYGTIKDYL